MKKTLAIGIAILAWFAVASQLQLSIEHRTTSIPETLLRFFTFFTILTNILVALYCTAYSLQYKKKLLAKPGLLTAITLYITIVGSVYQVALRHIWDPQGLQRIVDELLHSIVPILMIIFWVLANQLQHYKWKHLGYMLLYPLIYLGIVLLRGYYTNYYPYPFLDVYTFGWSATLLNIAILFCVVLAFASSFVAIGKFTRQKTRTKNT